MRHVFVFGSNLYRDYVETRCRALLKKAKETSDHSERQSYLKSLYAAPQSLEADDTECLYKHSLWARSLFADGVPEAARIGFVFEDSVAERLSFAAAFAPVSGEKLDWHAVRCFREPIDFSADVTWEKFDCIASEIMSQGLRKNVGNPRVAAWLDFRCEVPNLGGQIGGYSWASPQ